MNKKGAGEGVMFIAYVAIAMVIILGVVAGVHPFTKEYDFREVEAYLLRDRVIDCLKENDFFAQDFDFFSACKIEVEVFDSHMVYLKRGETEFVLGVRDYVNQCQLARKNENYARCVSGSYGDIEYVIGANQHSRRILA